MIGLPQFSVCLAILAVALNASAQSVSLVKPGGSPVGAGHFIPPLPPLPAPPVSPVVFFRQLLAMSPAERFQSLTNRPPQIRARILAKVHEYLLLPPDDRELRLQSTELRWYLTLLFHQTPADRQTRLAQMPEDMRGLVKSRLAQWDLLPHPLQQEFLANDRVVTYFAHVAAAGSAPTNSGQPQITAQFEQFFELTPEEKQHALTTLSDEERAQMEKTLNSFDQLSPSQRRLCVRNYARFAGMSAAERVNFLKNAERWSQMSPQERQTWRDLVAQVPAWPPMPAVIVPTALMPPHQPLKPRPSMATN